MCVFLPQSLKGYKHLLTATPRCMERRGKSVAPVTCTVRLDILSLHRERRGIKGFFQIYINDDIMAVPRGLNGVPMAFVR